MLYFTISTILCVFVCVKKTAIYREFIDRKTLSLRLLSVSPHVLVSIHKYKCHWTQQYTWHNCNDTFAEFSTQKWLNNLYEIIHQFLFKNSSGCVWGWKYIIKFSSICLHIRKRLSTILQYLHFSAFHLVAFYPFFLVRHVCCFHSNRMSYHFAIVVTKPQQFWLFFIDKTENRAKEKLQWTKVIR